MAKDSNVQMPGVFGGLMRYNDEYKSTLMFRPWQIIAAIVVLGVIVIAAKIFFPIVLPVEGLPVGLPVGGN
tara:strand:+ start:271 stop:483 length:213 start_codon:yes stop_codon:yes gene_type:complete